jgi:trimethylamine--corrinoid protein Co-methyltransferase
MEMDHVYPRLANRNSPKEWEERGKPDLLAGARALKEEILAQPAAARFDPVLDRTLRARFRIHLPA